MGLRDRDYMRRKPSDDDWRRYDKEMTEVEYGNALEKRQSMLRWLVIGFVLVILLIVIIAIFASSS